MNGYLVAVAGFGLQWQARAWFDCWSDAVEHARRLAGCHRIAILDGSLLVVNSWEFEFEPAD